MTKVLNPVLYNKLMRVFDNNVRIANQGVPFVGSLEKDPKSKRVRTVVKQAGEYYCVCCPVCGDTRNRLWVNHRWGSLMMQGQHAVTLRHLVVCYNENCQGLPNFRKLFQQVVDKEEACVSVLNTKDMLQVEITRAVDLPGSYTRIDQMPKQHAAVRYLQEVRHLDVRELGEVWNVMWIDYSTVLPVRNRLFFPFYDLDEHGKRILVGGQAHWLDVTTLNGTPPKDAKEAKWFTIPGTHKSQFLFNGWRAKANKDMVVVVEGPFDAVIVGPEHSVALFGHTASYRQRQLLYDSWGQKGGMGVLALDPDVAAEPAVRELEDWFKGWQYHCILRVPAGHDIGDYNHGTAWDMITAALP